MAGLVRGKIPLNLFFAIVVIGHLGEGGSFQVLSWGSVYSKMGNMSTMQLSKASLKPRPGEAAWDVVWQTEFRLEPGQVGFCSTIDRLLTYLPFHLVKLGDRSANV